MYKNYLTTGKKIIKSILITDDNEIVVIERRESIEEKNVVTRTVLKKKYQLVSIFKIFESKFAQCTDFEKIDWYDLDSCERILSLEKGSSVSIEPVAGEVFIKVVDAEKKFAYIYDSTGILIEKEVAPTQIDVVFGGCGPILQKKNEDGVKSFYTMEGYPA